MKVWRQALVALALSLLVCCGCSATAQVSVATRANGSGSVTVTVTLDKAATSAVGNVKSELQTSDLAAAGWAVTGPTTEADGSTVMSASKPFATLAQASAIVEEIAGSGPAASRPFQLDITRHRTFWKTTTTLSGDVNLSCGLSCFGDSGLQKTIGSSTGISPSAAGADPSDIFHFGMAVSLPGSLHSTNAASHRGTGQVDLDWTPTLGTDTQLLAVTETTDAGHVDEVTAAAVASGVVLLALIAWWPIRRWRKRRRRGAHAKRR